MFFDRIRYLLHCYYFGLVYHILLMVGVHVFLFWFVPYCDNRPFNQNCFAQIWYFFKAVYFLLSAYQIRCGYPGVLTTMYVFPQYGKLDRVLTKCYRIIPFLAEVKTLMDYVFTKTTLTRSEWFNFQSIYAEVYDLECSKSEKDSVRGALQECCDKFGWFIGLVFVLIIIFGPLFALYIGITVLGVTNNPMQVSMKISLGSFEPLFQVVADSDHIKVWTETEFENFRQDLSISKNAEEFVKDFGYRQIVTVTVGGESKRIWTISPPQYELLVDRLSPNNTKPVRLLFEWTLTNDPAVTDIVTSYGSNSVMLEQSSEERKHLYQLLKQTKRINTTDSAIIMNLFPQYVHSQSTSSTVRPAYNLYQGTGKTFTNVRLTLRRNDSFTWWRVFDDSTPKEKPNLQLTIFSDKVSHPHWDFIVSMGWTTLYLSIVLAVGGLIRQSCGSTSTIMFQELPNVKRILELCNDIYVAQENSMFKLEELLYAKLIFLYRSPTTLIKWTKPESLKENENELNNSSQDVVATSNAAPSNDAAPSSNAASNDDAPSNDAASNGSGCCCCC
uniref:Uncharacterized protein n=1 Tax=Ciona intestinalis TaxID=7719 RepID=Q69HR7_CIOIN|nr:hypothetical protein cihA1P10 [Ciona intestinalis]